MLRKDLTEEEKYNIGVALKKAIKKLAQSDPRTVCLNSAVIFNREEEGYILPYLNRRYLVKRRTGEVQPFSDEEGEVSIHLRILFLHYLSEAGGAPLQNEWITFKEIPGGQIYTGPYQKRTIQPLLQNFGEQPEKFMELAEDLGGQRTTFGDYAVTLHPFPRLPLTFVFWEGDEEFPATANILYDASAVDYLPTEDHVLLPSLIIWEMIARLGQE